MQSGPNPSLRLLIRRSIKPVLKNKLRKFQEKSLGLVKPLFLPFLVHSRHFNETKTSVQKVSGYKTFKRNPSPTILYNLIMMTTFLNYTTRVSPLITPFTSQLKVRSVKRLRENPLFITTTKDHVLITFVDKEYDLKTFVVQI